MCKWTLAKNGARPENVITNGGGLSLRRQLYGRQKTFRPAFKDSFNVP